MNILKSETVFFTQIVDGLRVDGMSDPFAESGTAFDERLESQFNRMQVHRVGNIISLVFQLEICDY